MKKLIAICVTALLLASTSASADDEVFAAFACQNLVLDYAWHWDHNNHEDFANLFTDDARFQAAGRQHTGRDEIFEAQKKRTGNVVTRMFFTNVRAVPVADDTVEATSYLMVHSEPVPEQESRRPTSIPTRGFRIIGEMAFTCRLTGDGWRISMVDLTPVFLDENLED